MKIAYLVAAHHQPEMLRRLVSALNHPAVYFFVHIDLKTAIEPFTRALNEFDNVRFVKRTSVNWMGFSQVRVALTLMQEALIHEDFSYFSLLSGSDYPIKPNEFILDFLSQNKTEYINYWRLEDRPSWIEKVEYYYLTDVFPIRDYYPKITLRGLYWRLFLRLKHYLPKRKKLDGIIFYGGSDWWTLTQDCVRYTLNFIDQNPDFVKFFQTTLSPCELFFQTIVLNSRFAQHAQNYQQYLDWSASTSEEDKRAENKMLPEDSFNLRYIDWSSSWDQRGYPVVLDERDLENLRASKDLFARKFDVEKSAGLLALIDRELLQRRA